MNGFRQSTKLFAGQKDSLYKLSQDIYGQSAEGVHATAYIDSIRQIRLIEITYYGETGRAAYEFYFSNDTLFFALEQQYNYNAPIYLTADKAKKQSKEEGIEYSAFDEKKTKVVEHRYYFDGQRLLKHLGPNAAMDGSRWDDTEQSARIRNISLDLLKKFSAQ